MENLELERNLLTQKQIQNMMRLDEISKELVIYKIIIKECDNIIVSQSHNIQNASYNEKRLAECKSIMDRALERRAQTEAGYNDLLDEQTALNDDYEYNASRIIDIDNQLRGHGKVKK